MAIRLAADPSFEAGRNILDRRWTFFWIFLQICSKADRPPATRPGEGYLAEVSHTDQASRNRKRYLRAAQHRARTPSRRKHPRTEHNIWAKKGTAFPQEARSCTRAERKLRKNWATTVSLLKGRTWPGPGPQAPQAPRARPPGHGPRGPGPGAPGPGPGPQAPGTGPRAWAPGPGPRASGPGPGPQAPGLEITYESLGKL